MMAQEGSGKKGILPWGLTTDTLKPNSVQVSDRSPAVCSRDPSPLFLSARRSQALSQRKLKAFSVGKTNPLKKANPLSKKKELELQKEARHKNQQKFTPPPYYNTLHVLMNYRRSRKRWQKLSRNFTISSNSLRNRPKRLFVETHSIQKPAVSSALSTVAGHPALYPYI